MWAVKMQLVINCNKWNYSTIINKLLEFCKNNIFIFLIKKINETLVTQKCQ